MLYYSQKLHKFYNTEEAAFEAEYTTEDKSISPKDIADSIEILLYDLQFKGLRYNIETTKDVMGKDVTGIDVKVVCPPKM